MRIDPPSQWTGNLDLLSAAGRDKAPALLPLRIAVIGTYPPQRCGIATFTRDVVNSLVQSAPAIEPIVYALSDTGAAANDDQPYRVIARDSIEDFARAADEINQSGVDAVWIQHEFGIFGGPDGNHVCEFINQLAPPLIITLHTVLASPSPRQEAVMEHLINRASRLMVMSDYGRRTLIDRYGADESQIVVIAHGAPERPAGRSQEAKRRFGWQDRQVLMTFGLLGPGKGLEHAISALPAIVGAHPDVLYRIVGATHPNLLREEGETYRQALEEMAERLGVADHIEWHNAFLDDEALLDQLEACDIYLTPYPNLEQVTSGTLSYAFALGKAIVSTPYRHAEELLKDGAGVLVEPGSPPAIAAAVCALLDDPDEMLRLSTRAFALGRQTTWPRFAAASERMIRSVVSRPPLRPAAIDGPSATGIVAMTDGVGMLQHAIGIIPDRNHGYCVDDNARALILMHDGSHLPVDLRATLALTYASFVQHAWNDDARAFRNFMGFDRSWLEERGSTDSFGRTLWALGATAARADSPDLRAWGEQWFDRCIDAFDGIEAPRSLALGSLGAAARLSADAHHRAALSLLERTGSTLVELYDRSRQRDWHWFESVLAYDNPRLPQALLLAGIHVDRPEWMQTALEALDWIFARQTSATGKFRPVGSESFGKAHAQRPFDQQPLECQAAIESAADAFIATGHSRWLDRAEMAYGWFFGANDRGLVLADMASGRCRDGLMPRGVNQNCGAESILAFHASHAAVMRLRTLAGARQDKGEAREGQSGQRLVTTS